MNVRLLRSALLATLVTTAALIGSGCSSSATDSASVPTTPSEETASAALEDTTSTAAPVTTTTVALAPETTPTTDPEPEVDVAVALQVALDDWRDLTGAPGAALAVLKDGEIVADLTSGTVALSGAEPVSTSDYFRIASITKPMASVMILQLVEDGLVELDAPVTDYLGDAWLGEHPSAGTITVRQLLDHTNGLIEYAFDPLFFIEAAGRQDTAYEPEEILEFLSRRDPLFEPGTEYSYETGGFVAAGLIVEELTGNSAASEMRSRVFEPAEANHIYLTPEEFPPEPVVNAYARGDLYNALRNLPGVEDKGETLANGDPVIDVLSGRQEVLQSAGWTGGGNEARMESVARIFAAMFDGTLLEPASIDAMTEPAFGGDEGYGLGLGIERVETSVGDTVTVWGHGGGVPGFTSFAGWLPDHGIAFALSTSLLPVPEGAGTGVLQKEMIEIMLSDGA